MTSAAHTEPRVIGLLQTLSRARTAAYTGPASLPFNPKPQPYRCPVCGGRGTMPHDFYTNIGYATSTEPVTCRSCGGRGVLFV